MEIKDSKKEETEGRALLDIEHIDSESQMEHDKAKIGEMTLNNNHSSSGMKLLVIIGIVFLCQGLSFVAVGHFDRAVRILPRDPITILGLAYVISGIVLCILAVVAGKFRRYLKSTDKCKSEDNSNQKNDVDNKVEDSGKDKQRDDNDIQDHDSKLQENKKEK